MRFPEFSLLQRKLGAQILTFPSAFTIPTGLAHWHTILRARAIETQCYVVAAAQTGQHNAKRSSYGHTLVVDPWGKIISEISEGSDIALADINLDYLAKIRQQMPIISHRRHDLYSLNLVSPIKECRLTDILPFPSVNSSYDFKPVTVRGSSIFLKTSWSQAFTNKKPFTPNHCLVTPERFVERFQDLTEAEVSDLAQIIVFVVKILRRHNSETENVQIVLQDGIDAGKTMQHLHVHVMPSVALTQGYEESTDVSWREEEEMTSESSSLRLTFKQLFQEDSWLHTCEIPRPLRLMTSEEVLDQCDSDPMSNEQMFCRSDSSFACLSADPILPGHAYVRCLREVSSVEDLSPREVVDLFLIVRKVESFLETFYGRSSSTIFLTDKPSASEPLTVHVVPRQENDLEENNDVYDKLIAHVIKMGSKQQNKNINDFINTGK